METCENNLEINHYTIPCDFFASQSIFESVTFKIFSNLVIFNINSKKTVYRKEPHIIFPLDFYDRYLYFLIKILKTQ
jgi:hypothetical protein